MSESRWVNRLGPLALGLVAAAVLASTSSAAVGRPASLPACPGDADPVVTAGAAPVPQDPGDMVGEPWYRLDPVLDETGTLAGQRLVAAVHGSPATTALELKSESFAAGPFGRLVLFGSDDGRRSELSALDVDRGCTIAIASERAVVRRATVDPSGEVTFEHRVDRATRADLGVFRRPLVGGAAVRVVPPLAVEPRFGPTFSTELAWSADGDRLAVHSCGAVHCRLRVFDPASGEIASMTEPGLGGLVGVTADRAIVHGVCMGLPCPIWSVEMTSGRRIVLADAAGPAVLTGPSEPRVAFQTPNGHGLRVVDPAGRHATVVALPWGDLRLLSADERASTGSRVPAGWLIVVPETSTGRPATDGPVLVRLSDGLAVEVAEVAP